jgi:hypothetical protein
MYKIAAEYDLLLPIESDLASTGGEFAIETGQIHPNCSIFVCGGSVPTVIFIQLMLLLKLQHIIVAI